MAVKHTLRTISRSTHDVEEINVDLTRGKAIKYFCLECLGGYQEDIRNCTVEKCALYPFRPYR